MAKPELEPKSFMIFAFSTPSDSKTQSLNVGQEEPDRNLWETIFLQARA